MENENSGIMEQSVQAPTRPSEQPAMPQRLAFSVRETALMLGISEKSVRRLIDRGLLRRSRALRHLLIPRSEIEGFLRDTTSR